jgi:pimeloyl-ACP methyl ester carboxylesterase
MSTQIKRNRPVAQNIGRMIGHGMNVEDYIKLTNATECNCDTFEKVKDGDDFVLIADKLGDEAYTFAKEQEKLGNTVTASEFYLNACACYRLADYGINELTDEKKKIYTKVPLSFQKGKALSIYEKVEVVEIPFEGKTMPGYFVIPDNTPIDSPVLVFISGATGFKEENYLAALKFWERGIPFIIFDGPGQGESLYFRDIFYTVDNYEKACKSVIDFIKKDSRVGNKIALFGMSYGGYLATRCAYFLNDDICALIVRGGCSQTNQLTEHKVGNVEHFYLQGFKLKFNEYDNSKAIEISNKMNIEPYLKNITVPTLIQHSKEDYILGTKGSYTIFNNISSTDKEYAQYPGSTHCADDQHEKVSSYAADWLVKRV